MEHWWRVNHIDTTALDEQADEIHQRMQRVA